MAKKVIDIVIDGNTGKISIHVDGYEHEACTELARKLAGSNVLIPTKGELTIPERSGKKAEKKQKDQQKEEVKQ
jgi:aerobic-type carbon monoxide dehydrogenase small subunit (CoxS/CutS family)